MSYAERPTYGTETGSFPSRVEMACQRLTSMELLINFTDPSSNDACTPLG